MSPAHFSRDPAHIDVWRIDGTSEVNGNSFKEWQHFTTFVDGLDLLVNFSVEKNGDSGHPGRVIVLARTDSWHGEIVSAPAVLSADARHITIGAASMRIERGAYHVSVDWPEKQLSVALSFVPRAVAAYATHRPTADRRRLYWAFVARLTVSGRVTIADRAFEIVDAPAYHDHNWGSFSWGSDFAWEWGAVLPEDRACPYACVWSRVTNRARTVMRSQHLFLWRHAYNVFTVEGDALDGDVSGRFHPPGRPFRLPRALALLDPRDDTDLPKTLNLSARAGADSLSVSFEADGASRVLIPSEVEPLGKVVIHECIGSAFVHGEVAGEAFEWRGRGVFEFLRS